MKRKRPRLTWLILVAVLLPACVPAKNIYKVQGEEVEFSTVYMEREPEPRIHLRREGDKESPVFILFNDFWGPVEVELTLKDSVNVLADPSLPARFVIPAQTERTLVGIRALDQRQGFSYRLGMSSVPGRPLNRVPGNQIYYPPFPASNQYSISQAKDKVSAHDTSSRYAVDFPMPQGSKVLVARSGIVMDLEDSQLLGGSDQRFAAYANQVRILHDDGTMSVYAHLEPHSARVAPGSRVKAGTWIANSGETGLTSGPHLHFGVQVNVGMKIQSVPIRFHTPTGTVIEPLTNRIIVGVLDANNEIENPGVAAQSEPPKISEETKEPVRLEKQEIPYSDLVFRVQGLLKIAGYNPGPQDGRAGVKTIAAVKQFQSGAELEPTGQITQELAVIIAIYLAATKSELQQEEVPPSPEIISTGTGIVVSTDGYVVTNHHVIDECPTIKIRVKDLEYSAKVIASDQKDDLALLKTSETLSDSANLSESRRAELGQFVMVAGFPLHGLLSDDMGVTSGTVSALAGINNDRRFLQISAPVQPGNSGGALINKKGEVIGTVVSKLDAVEVYKYTGDIPQNINFALKSSILKSFLDINEVNYKTADNLQLLEPSEIAKRAKTYTALITCLE